VPAAPDAWCTALARWEGIGVALWGLPLLGCAAVGYEPVVLLLLMAAIGVGKALLDLGLLTLPARMVPEELIRPR
jgi:hypothetical protein